MLLPRDVPRDVEQQRAADLDRVRRGVSWPGGIDAAAALAADKYIAEREGKRANGLDISKHYRYIDRSDGAGVVAYAG
ncbi:hypothetical protein ACVBEH_31910, partial [Roseateles sp. GG27B]